MTSIDAPTQQVARTKYHLVLFQHPDLYGPYSQIDRDLFALVQDALDRVIKTPKEQTEIDVWLDSPGGDAHAAFKLVLELRSRCHVLRAVVPDRAKSAATLLVLGTDQIYMAASAELGPLDAQIDHPGKDNITISALDVADSLAFMGQAAFEIGFTGGAEIVFQLGLPRIEVLNAVLQFSSQLVAPVAAKLDPHLIHQATNLLRVTEQYAHALLSERRSQASAPQTDSAEMVRKLVKEYPAHGYVICRDEARKLGLVIEDAEAHPRWKSIKTNHRLFRKRETSIIQVIPDVLLDGPPKTHVKAEAHGSEAPTQQSTGAGSSAEPSTVSPVATTPGVPTDAASK